MRRHPGGLALAVALFSAGCGYLNDLGEGWCRGPFDGWSDERLVATLKSGRASKRAAAAREFALWRSDYGDPLTDRSLDALRSSCADPDPRVRLWASTACWKRGDPAAPVPEPVISALSLHDPATCEEALEALREYGGNNESVCACGRRISISLRTSRILGVSAVSACVCGRRPSVSLESIPEFVGPARALAPMVVQLLRSGDRLVRREACKTLGAIDHESRESTAALIAATTDVDLNVSEEAIKALGEQPSPSPEIQRALLVALRSSNSTLRREAASSLGKQGFRDPSAVPDLVPMLWGGEDQSPVADLLAGIGSPALPSITARLDDPDARARSGALQALRACAAKGVTIPETVIEKVLATGEDRDLWVRKDRLVFLAVSRPDAERTAIAIEEGKHDRSALVRQAAQWASEKVVQKRVESGPSREPSPRGNERPVR